MALLSILFALITERLKPHWTDIRSLVWFEHYVEWLRMRFGAGRVWNGPLGVLVILVLPLILVVVLEHQLGQIWGLLAFLFQTVILYLSLGPRDLDSDVEAFLSAYSAGDEPRMRGCARALLGGEEPRAQAELMRSMVGAVIVEANERILNVVFWFIVLGPLGAAMYRLASALKDECTRRGEAGAFHDAALVLHAALAWGPVRMTILAYALAGSFTDAVQGWRRAAMHSAVDWISTNRISLMAAGLGALQLDHEEGRDARPAFDANQVRAALALVWRAVIIVIAVIAIVTLAGWGV